MHRVRACNPNNAGQSRSELHRVRYVLPNTSPRDVTLARCIIRTADLAAIVYWATD